MENLLSKSTQVDSSNLNNLPKSLLTKNGSFDPNYKIIKAPGRVNLIGEHVDYCGYPVLPMAIENSTFIKFRVENDHECFKIDLKNVNFEKYGNFWFSDGDRKFSKNNILDDPEKLFSKKSGAWENYFLAGFVGMVKYLQIENPNFILPKIKIEAILDCNIPPAAGLSSSSSIVVASGLLAFNIFSSFSNSPIDLDPLKFATLMAESEKYIGTAGGGMDQAISILAEKNKVSLISFLPKLKTQNFTLPENVSIIVAHSGKIMEKAKSNDFNERVLCTKYAAKILSNGEFEVLKDFIDEGDLNDDLNNESDSKISKIIENLPEEMTFGQLKEKYGYLSEKSMARFESISDDQVCRIKSRARHVLSECQRVQAFINPKNCENLPFLGQFMNESQKSLKNDYNCSCPEIDWLCEKMLKLGAFGARLTGAGWGGCAICLVDRGKAVENNFLEKLKIEMVDRGIDDPIAFVSEPSSGIEIFEVREVTK